MIKVLLGIQYFILGIVFITGALFCFFVFEIQSVISYILFAIVGIILIYFTLKKDVYSVRIITIAASASLLLNMVMNLHFYPNLLEYQAGSSIAEVVEEQEIPVDVIYKLSEEHTWALDFYNRMPVKITTVENLVDKDNIWVYASGEELELLKDAGLDWNKQFSVNDFRITRLQVKFLDPASRKKILHEKYLIHIFK
jgi:competence CoiA-like predicted nuclease